MLVLDGIMMVLIIVIEQDVVLEFISASYLKQQSASGLHSETSYWFQTNPFC